MKSETKNRKKKSVYNAIVIFADVSLVEYSSVSVLI